jgi:hypothetical protein
MRGVNVLLDEFEEKVGKGKLSPEYIQKRREMNDRLSKPVSTSSIDKEISEIKQSMTDVEGRIEAGRARIASRILELKDEQARCSADLAREQKRIAGLAAEPKSDSFLKRLFGGNSKTPARNSGAQINELESRLRALPDEILGQQKLLKSVELRSPESPFVEDWKVFDSLETRLQALENVRLEDVQLVKEREETTASVADAISRMGP